MSIDSRLPKFRSLAPAERLQHLQALLDLPADDVALLREPGALALERADGMIENVIGTFELPYAVARNFQITGRALEPVAAQKPNHRAGEPQRPTPQLAGRRLPGHRSPHLCAKPAWADAGRAFDRRCA